MPPHNASPTGGEKKKKTARDAVEDADDFAVMFVKEIADIAADMVLVFERSKCGIYWEMI